MAAANLKPFYRLPDLAPNSCINPSPASSSLYGTVKALQSRRCCNNSTSRHSSETHQAESVSTLLKSQMRNSRRNESARYSPLQSSSRLEREEQRRRNGTPTIVTV